MARPTTSRRTFVAGLAAASGAALSAPAGGIRVAKIGTGHGHAASKIKALRALPEYELAGICRPEADEPGEGEVFRGVRWMSMEEALGDATIEWWQ
jgi:hypothetical protein